MTILLGFAQCADAENGVIAGGVVPALERSEGPFASPSKREPIALPQGGQRNVWPDGYRYRKADALLVSVEQAITVGSASFDQRDDPRALTRLTLLDGLNACPARSSLAL